MKRLFLIVLMLSLLLSIVPAAFAEETTETTQAVETTEATQYKDPTICGENLTWSYNGGTLTVTGTGAMDDMSGGAPWAAHKDEITTVILSGGVTTVGAEAFKDCGGITAIDFGESLREIGTRAFQNCDGLKKIYLPASFKKFGEECFSGCDNLTEVYCQGGMPSFKANCLWNGNTVIVYCPTNNVWPETYVQELERNFGGRLQIFTADGEDPFDFTEPTEVTEAPTTVPTTEPEETETQPVTEETTVPTTEAATVPTTEAEETVETTEVVPTQPDRERTGSAIGMAIVVMVLSALGLGALIFGRKRSRGGKYSR